jgi:hypothetical protein
MGYHGSDIYIWDILQTARSAVKLIQNTLHSVRLKRHYIVCRGATWKLDSEQVIVFPLHVQHLWRRGWGGGAPSVWEGKWHRTYIQTLHAEESQRCHNREARLGGLVLRILNTWLTETVGVQMIRIYEGVSKRFRTESIIMKYTLTFGITRWKET